MVIWDAAPLIFCEKSNLVIKEGYSIKYISFYFWAIVDGSV